MPVKFATPAPTGRSTKRIATLGSLAAVLIAALLAILAILDVVSGSEMRATLGRSLAVVGVSTLALVLSAVILKAGRESGNRHEQ